MGGLLSTLFGAEAARRRVEESNNNHLSCLVDTLARHPPSGDYSGIHPTSLTHHQRPLRDKPFPPPPSYEQIGTGPPAPPPYSLRERRSRKRHLKPDGSDYKGATGLGRSNSFVGMGILTKDGRLDPRLARSKTTGSRPTPRNKRWYVSAVCDYNRTAVRRDADAGVVTWSDGWTETVSDGSRRRRHHE